MRTRGRSLARTLLGVVAFASAAVATADGAIAPATVALSSAQRAAFPWRAVAGIKFPRGSCLATFTGPSELRTAAHCVLGRDGWQPSPVDELTVVLPTEVAAVVGRGRFPVVAVDSKPGWFDARADWERGTRGARQFFDPTTGFYVGSVWPSQEARDLFWLIPTHDTVTVRIAEPIGEMLGYFGIYRNRRGAIGSLGGENLTALCAYDELLDPGVRAEWHDSINLAGAQMVAPMRPRVLLQLHSRSEGSLPDTKPICKVVIDRSRYHATDPLEAWPVRVSTCPLFGAGDFLMTFNQADSCDTHRGDSGGPLFIVEDKLPVLVGNLFGGRDATGIPKALADILAEDPTGVLQAIKQYEQEVGLRARPERKKAPSSKYPFLADLGPRSVLYYGDGEPEVLATPGVVMWAALHWAGEGDASFLAGDFEKALEYYERAAEFGDFRAPYALSVMYRDGLGTKPDAQASISHLLDAVEAGCPMAMAEAASELMVGRHIEQDSERAYELALAAYGGWEGTRFPGAGITHAVGLLSLFHLGAFGILEADYEEANKLVVNTRSHPLSTAVLAWHACRLFPEDEDCRAGGQQFARRLLHLPFSRRGRELAAETVSEPLDAYVFLSLAAAEGSAAAAAELEERSFSPEIVAEGDSRVQEWRVSIAEDARVELPRCFDAVWPRGIPNPEPASVEIDYWTVAPGSLRLSPLDVVEAVDAWEKAQSE